MPAPGLLDYLKKNAKFAYGGGALGLPFLAGDIKGIADADNKFKALLRTFKDFVLIRVAMVGLFTGVGAAVKALVRETGSLEQALKKLGQMQVFSRQLSGLVGGLTNARKRIAELNELSTKAPFKFDELAEANQSLETFTRGAYSSVEATREVGQAAIATGNNIGDTARAVGDFYANLREGQPIRSSAEQLRAMGLISQSTADHLDAMAQSGQDSIAVFGELTAALKSTASGAEGYKSELASISDEHEKAVQELQTKFAAPFTESETKNVQNMTAAMKGITPTIGTIAQSLATVYTGFSTVTSTIAKFTGESKIAQGALKYFIYLLEAATVAAVAFGTVAAAQLTPSIIGMGSQFVAMGGAIKVATLALRGLALITVWGAVLVAVTGVVGAVINMTAKTKEAQKAFNDWIKTQRESVAALAAQAAAIKTVADKNAFLAKSIGELIDKEGELAKVREQRKKDEEFLARLKKYGAPEGGDPYAEKALERANKQSEKRERILKQGIETIKQQNAEVTKQTPAHEALIQAESERRFIIEEQTKSAQERDYQSRAGLQAQADVQDRQSEVNTKLIEQQQRLTQARVKFEELPGVSDEKRERKYKQFEDRERNITELMKEHNAVALEAPEFSSTYLGAKALQLDYARKANELEARLQDMKGKGFTEEERRDVRVQAERARALAGGAQYTPEALAEAQARAGVARKREEDQPSPFEARQQSLERYNIETQIREHEARRRGDYKMAAGFENIGRFQQHFQELLPLFGKVEAANLARKQTEDEIKEKYFVPQVVSSMQAIAGGGNIGQVDPAMQIAREQKDLQLKMVEYLAILAGADTGLPGQSTFQ